GDSALRVAATPGSLLALALRRGDDAALAPGRIEIAGDAELARRLEKLASRYRPDFEEAFSRVFGDVIGVKIAQAFGTALGYARDRGQALLRDGADYLREESRDLVAGGEMDEFLDDVDALRERSERLQARIARLATAGRRA
ncbi:ubiquinone biosynthesis accessory factor UbiJ, partial [Tahibacter caeni]|uniref:ubiquinone biosynthesis accessory factor UbiJ n=1 Tax=Tahibacter caeni TaxID=1453545 RepID=UPI003CCCDF13